MQNSDEQFLVNQTGTPGTAVDFSKYQDLSANVLSFNSFQGLVGELPARAACFRYGWQYGTYPPKGYFRLWPVNMTYAEAQDDVTALAPLHRPSV